MRSYQTNIAEDLKRLQPNKDTDTKWTEEKEELFIKIGTKINQTALHLVDINYNKFITCTDVSKVGLTGSIYQIKNGEEFLLGYYSKYIKKSKLNYSIPILKLIAGVKTVINFKTILFGNHFIWYTDSEIVTLMTIKQDDESKYRLINNLLFKILEFNFDIVHCPREKNQFMDKLSKFTKKEKMSTVKIVSDHKSSAITDQEAVQRIHNTYHFLQDLSSLN
jgi:hypothetical protein